MVPPPNTSTRLFSLILPSLTALKLTAKGSAIDAARGSTFLSTWCKDTSGTSTNSERPPGKAPPAMFLVEHNCGFPDEHIKHLPQ